MSGLSTKKCTQCGLEKLISEFYKNQGAKCKLCKRAYEKQYLSKNKEKVFLAKKLYRESHSEKLSKQKKKWRLRNKKHIAVVLAKWYSKNKDKKKKYESSYLHTNKQKVLTYQREYRRKRMEKDPLFDLMVKIRRLISVSLKQRGFSKRSKTYQYLGCSFEELQHHLEETFKANYGRPLTKEDKVHIDHIIPCASASSEEEMIRLQHFSNLQWLLAKDNFQKGDSLEWTINEKVPNL